MTRRTSAPLGWMTLAVVVGISGPTQLLCAQAVPLAAPAAAQPALEPSSSTDTPVPAAPAAPTPAPEVTFEQLRGQLEAMREELAAQRAELDRQKAHNDASNTSAGTDAQEAALAALASGTAGGSELATDESMLRVYGFADTGMQKVWGSLYDTGLSLTDASNFVLGNVNLYFDAKPDDRWRALIEVRLTLFPNGAESLDAKTNTFTTHDTTIFDYTSSVGGFTSVRWSALILERAHIDYTPYDAFNVRVGYFLTPYGIWNVDHGSPTRIMLRAPFSVTAEIFPERQTGVDAFGRFLFLPWELGYHLYVSNGRELDAVDYTEDKSVGARVYLSTRRPIGLQLGASFFHGSAQQRSKTVGSTSTGTLGIVRVIDVDQTESAAGADLSIDVDALRIRSEYAMNLTQYNNGKRALFAGYPLADAVRMDAYVVVAYRLPWLGLEPLVLGEIVRYPTLLLGEGFVTGGGGINVYLSQATTLRTLYSYIRSENFTLHGPQRDYGMHTLAARLVMAF